MIAGVLLDEFEKSGPIAKDLLLSLVLKETTNRGRDLQTQLRRARLYGTDSERGVAGDLFKTQISIYLATWSYAQNPKAEQGRLQEIRTALEVLERAEEDTIHSHRTELGMPRLASAFATAAESP